MTTQGDPHKRRGANIMKIGLGMLVFGIAIALGFSYGQDEPNAVTGWAGLIALAGFITAIVGLGKWRERPADN
jgi:small-conductance mechanosensitive channel